MVEGVERLGEDEGVLRQHGELEGAYDLLDDFVEARRLEDQRLEFVAAGVAGQLLG